MEEELKNFKLKKIDKPAETNTNNIKVNPSNTPSQPNTTESQSQSKPAGYNTMLEEMKKVQLKKVDKVEPVPVARPKMNHTERDFISNALSQAISARRVQLTKNDNSETSSCEWSD